MLLVKTKLDISDIHGVGLFADEFIPAGTVTWRFNALIDLRFPPGDLQKLSEHALSQIQKYSYREKHSGLYVLCGDDARFFNHSDTPNCIDIYVSEDTSDDEQDVTIALRDIQADEELTCNYALFDLDLLEGKYELPGVEKEMRIYA
ncbi:MAG: SET domain-containing protein [Pyrinomonadaceae bacterium]